jgi:uncharacterized protein
VIVVSNTSPLLNLACIGGEGMLESLFGSVQVPPEVPAEIEWLRVHQPRFSRVHVPTFVHVTPVSNPALATALNLNLDAGEAAAVALALELKADVLLIDEHRGRTVAKRLGVSCLGLLGTLALAKRRGLIPAVAPLLQRLESEAGFWVGSALRERILAGIGEGR